MSTLSTKNMMVDLVSVDALQSSSVVHELGRIIPVAAATVAGATGNLQILRRISTAQTFGINMLQSTLALRNLLSTPDAHISMHASNDIPAHSVCSCHGDLQSKRTDYAKAASG